MPSPVHYQEADREVLYIQSLMQVCAVEINKYFAYFSKCFDGCTVRNATPLKCMAPINHLVISVKFSLHSFIDRSFQRPLLKSKTCGNLQAAYFIFLCTTQKSFPQCMYIFACRNRRW